jgi:hypothetical protein
MAAQIALAVTSGFGRLTRLGIVELIPDVRDQGEPGQLTIKNVPET